MSDDNKTVPPSGWLILDKPRGMGSTQGVSAVKRNLREGGYAKTKVGHGGTLDPQAEGVLPIALGEATKLAGRMLDATKTYVFTIRFGEETDTLDTEGEVIARSDRFPPLAAVAGVLDHFTGEIEQVPPAYSALKVDGKRAYDMARAGEDVELATRAVTIYALQILPGTGRGTIRRMVEGHVGTLLVTADRTFRRCPSTVFDGPPPRTGEDLQRVNGYRPRFHLDVFPRPREVVGALSVNLERGIGGRHLLYFAGEVIEHTRHRRQRRKAVAARNHLALGIERVGLLPELDREDVGLGRVEHAARQLGRLAQRDRQHALGQRIKRAPVPHLGLGVAAFAQHALDRADALGRPHGARLVEHDPAIGRGFGIAHAPATQSAIDRKRPIIHSTGGPIVLEMMPVSGNTQTTAISRTNTIRPTCCS